MDETINNSCIICFNNIPKESSPDVSLPYIYVSLGLTGISPEDSEKLLITHNNLSHDCYAMKNWKKTLDDCSINKKNYDIVFLDEIQFMDSKETVDNIEIILR